MHVNKPTIRKDQWVVVIKDSNSPLASDIEVVTCSSQEDAYQAYRRIMKELGHGY